jgi:hypothetical protein
MLIFFSFGSSAVRKRAKQKWQGNLFLKGQRDHHINKDKYTHDIFTIRRGRTDRLVALKKNVRGDFLISMSQIGTDSMGRVLILDI